MVSQNLSLRLPGSVIYTFKWVNPEEERTTGIMYVNSPEGLRIRKEPNQNSDILGMLKNKEEIVVIDETNFSTIDEISSTWKEISSGSRTGWIFGGYLEKDLSIIDHIQEIEGTYYFKEIVEKKEDGLLFTNDEMKKLEEAYIKIKYLGKKKFRINYKYGVFTDKWETTIDEIINSDLAKEKYFLFLGADKGGGGFEAYFAYKNRQIEFMDNYHKGSSDIYIGTPFYYSRIYYGSFKKK